ncbi:MAG: winged helix-turn-helix transcriptional regulator [Nanoarchaeota archaeon]|nr:winged helix-turn-helix transcriptional regulator [Nanoarchaeota archaeon]
MERPKQRGPLGNKMKLIHRDYFDNAEDILIEIFRNKLAVSNPGGLVKGLKPEDFGRKSRTRNSLVANLLLRTDYVEKLGTGINRIKQALKNANLPEPLFKYNSSFLVELYDKTIASRKVGEKVGKKVGENQEKILGMAKRKNIRETVEKTVEKIIGILKRNPNATQKDIAEKTGLSRRGVEWNIHHLKNKGIIKRIGPAKGGHWEIR